MNQCTSWGLCQGTQKLSTAMVSPSCLCAPHIAICIRIIKKTKRLLPQVWIKSTDSLHNFHTSSPSIQIALLMIVWKHIYAIEQKQWQTHQLPLQHSLLFFIISFWSDPHVIVSVWSSTEHSAFLSAFWDAISDHYRMKFPRSHHSYELVSS
jgi:hypothetical protein